MMRDWDHSIVGLVADRDDEPEGDEFRFSTGATAHAAALTLAVFALFGWRAPPHPDELGVMTVGLAMMLTIGWVLTRANREMLAEATAKQLTRRRRQRG